jgi:hypothetical protein
LNETKLLRLISLKTGKVTGKAKASFLIFIGCAGSEGCPERYASSSDRVQVVGRAIEAGQRTNIIGGVVHDVSQIGNISVQELCIACCSAQDHRNW